MPKRNQILLLIFSLFCIINSSLFSQSIYQFKNYTINEGLSQSSVICLFQDENYGLWIGTQDGLNRFDGKSFEVFTPDDTKGLESGFIHSIKGDKKGNLWIATANGLVCYNKLSDQFTTYNPEDQFLSFEQIFIDDDKNVIWATTPRKGVWTFDIGTKKFTPKTSIFTSRLTKNVFMSSEGIYFVYSEDKGLEAYNPKTGQLKQIDFPSRDHVEVNFFNQVEEGN